MDKSEAKICFISDQAKDMSELVDGLRLLGFLVETKIAREDDHEYPEANNIFVVDGNLLISTTGLKRWLSSGNKRRNRTIVLCTGLQQNEISTLIDSGLKYIDTSVTAPIENLIYMISCMDINLIHRASKRQNQRARKAAMIETALTSLFGKLRHASIGSAIAAAETHRKNMEELLAMSPLSVWLNLLQNYHSGTIQHCALVSCLSLTFAKALRFGPISTDRLFKSAFFHDIGKIMISPDILNKPGPFNAEEWKVVKRHPLFSYEILMQDERTAGEVARVARDHHEFLDGSGYPYGIKAADINDATRIVTICDIAAALLEKRPYKLPKMPEEAYSILQSMAETKLDPDLVRILKDIFCEHEERLSIPA